jgi:hypothetical protein
MVWSLTVARGGLVGNVSTVVIIGLLGSTVTGQAPAPPPVIDVHVHSTNTTPQQALERMKSLNIRFLVVSSLTSDLPQWAGAFDAARFLPGLVFPCADGRAPITGGPCFDSPAELPDVAWLTGELKADAGFGKRIMFGSDFPEQAGPGIDAVLGADFLSAEQKADILCNNAARFLRLDSSLCGG